jgi:hypothetical protein
MDQLKKSLLILKVNYVVINYNKVHRNNFFLAFVCIFIIFASLIITTPYMTKASFAQRLDNDVTQAPLSSLRPTSLPSESLIQIAAGKVQDLNFSINANTNTNIFRGQPSPTITDLAVSLISQSASVKILGNSRWNLQTVQPDSNQLLSTKVYASPSLIGTPVFFTVSVQYIQNGQQLKADSFDLGAVVVGDVKLSLNNVGIRYIGDTPNLVGNILNQGNTPALFTSVEMLKQGQGVPASSAILPISSDYLGSIPVNTPMPFNIPLKILEQTPTKTMPQKFNPATNTNKENTSLTTMTEHAANCSSSSDGTAYRTERDNNTAANLYPISIKIMYTDDLKNNHELVVNKTIDLGVQSGPQQQIMPNQDVVNTTEIRQLQILQEQQQPSFTNGFIDAYWAANTSVGIGGASGNSTSSTGAASSTLPIPAQQEVGPGEGQSILAVVLSNTEFSDINGIIGYITLPAGFSSATASANSLVQNHQQLQISKQQQQIAIASFNDLVKSGQTYTLYFKVNIDKGAAVGNYLSSLRIFYFKVPELEPGQYSSQTFKIPFALPGKVILDAFSKSTSLIPGVSNEAKIEIRNKGSAEAHSVIVSVTGVTGNSIANNVVINQPSSSSANNTSSTSPTGQVTTTSPLSSIPTVNLGARTFDIGTVPVNGTAQIIPIIYPSNSAGGTLQNLNLQITYTAANGDAKSSNVSVGFLVLPTPPEAGISVSPSNSLPPNSRNNNDSRTNNNTTAGISVSPSSLNTNGNDANRKNLAHFISAYPNEKINSPSVLLSHPMSIPKDSNPMILTVYNIKNNTSNGALLQRTASTSNNNPSTNNNMPSNLNNTSLILVAGKIQDMKFNIANNNDFPITNGVASIISESSDLKIVGDSLWSIPSFSPHSRHEFTTKVFASTSLIGAPVSFVVTLQYLSGGQSKIGSFILGGNVVGDIRVTATDLAINYVAGIPNLVGNLLNQGNTIGLFTTVQLINQPFSSSTSTGGNGPSTIQEQHHTRNQGAGSTRQNSSSSSLLPPAQYLGDLQPDSPLPFSIPLNMNNNTAFGNYPISLKVIYSDDLKNSHEVILNKTLEVKPQQSRSRGDHGSGNSILGIPFPIVLIAIISAVVIVTLLLIRKRRRSKIDNLMISENGQENLNNNDEEEDIESLLDSYLGPGEKKKGHSSGDRKTPVGEKRSDQ